jgi:hypothetical protein
LVAQNDEIHLHNVTKAARAQSAIPGPTTQPTSAIGDAHRTVDLHKSVVLSGVRR